jgi:hypothetical protein
MSYLIHKNSAEAAAVPRPRWVSISIPIGVLVFILALLGSAIVVPQLRLLHLLQALIYVAILILTRRNSPWGFGVAVFISTAWNCLNLFVTHLFAIGAGLLWTLYPHRPVKPAGYGHGFHSQPGSFPVDRRMYGWVPPAPARQKAMVSFFCRRPFGVSLYGANYCHCRSAVISKVAYI